MLKNFSKSFSDASDSSDTQENIKQINTQKPFNLEPGKAIPKKPLISEEENNCEETNLTPQDKIGNIDWYRCGCECKPIAIFAEHFCCRNTNEILDENFQGT